MNLAAAVAVQSHKYGLGGQYVNKKKSKKR